MKILVTIASCVLFAVSGYAAEADKPAPSPSASVERESGAGQPAKPAPQATKPVTELRFEPPPVPDFMLKKPEKPLTVEEMQRQADEASERARRARAAADAAPPSPGPEAGARKNEAPVPGK